MVLTDRRMGEIIETSSTGFIAQCYELNEVPGFGSVTRCRCGDGDIFGVVYNVTTSSLEPGRRPLARGKDQPREEDIYRENPQLLTLLRSEFSCIVAGHRVGDNLMYYLPPAPARIHGFVYECGDDDLRSFSGSPDFLNLLINAGTEVPIDELIAATIRLLSRVQSDPRAFLVDAGKRITGLLGRDFNRVRAILGRIKQ